MSLTPLQIALFAVGLRLQVLARFRKLHLAVDFPPPPSRNPRSFGQKLEILYIVE